MATQPLAIWCILIVFAGTSPDGDGQDKPDAARKSAKPAAAKDEKLPAFTPEREAAALTFVRRNHPELGEVLAELKSANRKTEYEQAISELFQVSENLSLTQARDPRRYELELKAWQVHSRIYLLAAKRSMGPNDGVEQELKAALAEQADVRLKLLELERERIAERLQKLDAQIVRLRQSQTQSVEDRYQQLVHGPRKPRPKAEAKAKSDTSKAATTGASARPAAGAKSSSSGKPVKSEGP